MSDEIVTEGDPVLRGKSQKVPKNMFGTKELLNIVYRMSKALRAAPHGVAIAAPQIGVPYRIFVVRGFVMENRDRNDLDVDITFVNPKMVRLSRKKISIDGEGCLSVPDVYGTVVRHEKAKVVAYDVYGKKFERGGSDLVAEIFQHEIDHLEGMLFIDHATNVKKTEPEKVNHE